MTKTKKIVLSALFAALTCVATMVIRIPTPGTGGYIHPGDAIVILSGVFLGPLYGALAAGIGSALSDLLGGYFIYVPITLVIKGASAFLAGYAFGALKNRITRPIFRVAIGGVINMILVAVGYFVCEIPLYSFAAAAASVPSNLVQGIGGLAISLVLYPALAAIPDFRVTAPEDYRNSTRPSSR